MYHVFQFLHISLRELVVGKVLRAVGHAAHHAAVIAPVRARHVGEVHRRVHLLGNALRAREYRRVVVEKVDPVVCVASARCLIRDKADNRAHALAAERKHAAQRVVFGDIFCSEARAQVGEQAVKQTVVERAVKLGAMRLGVLGPNGQRADPFPVAVMPEVDEHEGVVLQVTLQILYALKRHAAHDFLAAHREQLERLKGVVAEKAVKPALYLPDAPRRSVGERRYKVSAHHLTAIAHNEIDHRTTEVRDEVKQLQGHARARAQNINE